MIVCKISKQFCYAVNLCRNNAYFSIMYNKLNKGRTIKSERDEQFTNFAYIKINQQNVFLSRKLTALFVVIQNMR